MADNSDLEEIRKKKLLEMQQQMALREAQEELADSQAEAIKEQKKAIMRQILTPEARERLSRLRLVRPELVDNVEMQLIYLVEAGRIREKINDATLKEILKKLQGPPKRDFKIEYK